ncbi:MAG: hypothetical protein U0271_07935 [Polyangiaceae bacterium]
MTLRGLLAACLAVMPIAMTSGLARADEQTTSSSRIVLVTREPTSPISMRLTAELGALGFEVVTAPPPSDMRDPSDVVALLERTSREANALAAIVVSVRGGAVEVWIRDRTTDKTVLREVVRPGDGTDEELVAVRAVELLRASLLETQSPRAPKGEVNPGEAAEKLASSGLPAPRIEVTLPAPRASEELRPTPTLVRSAPGSAPGLAPLDRLRDVPLVGLSAAFGAFLGGIDLPPQLTFEGTFRYMPTARFGLSLHALAPAWSPQLSVMDLSATVRFGGFGVGPRFELGPTRGRFGFTLEPSIALGWVSIDAIDPLVVGGTSGVDQTLFTFESFLRASFSVRIAGPFSLRADLFAGFALPGRTLVFGGSNGGFFGAPVFGSTVGPDLAFDL